MVLTQLNRPLINEDIRDLLKIVRKNLNPDLACIGCDIGRIHYGHSSIPFRFYRYGFTYGFRQFFTPLDLPFTFLTIIDDLHK